MTVLWLRELAALGAHARIAQLEAANAANLAEIELIRREFKLKDQSNAVQDSGNVLQELRKKHEHPADANSSGIKEEKPRRKRRRKTPAQRKAISRRMKKYWAEQRAQQE